MKFCGKIGFWIESVETAPDVYKSKIVEKTYTGDILSAHRGFQSSNSRNGDYTINNRISILSDIYLRQNWTSIRYVIWNNVKLKVTDVDISPFPRAYLTIGDIYNSTEEVQNGDDENRTK